MKNIFKYILCSVLLFCPFLVRANVTCYTDNYSATISIDKDKLSMNDRGVIIVNSNDRYEIEYIVEDKSILKVNNVGVISPLKAGATNIDVKVHFLVNGERVSNCNGTIKVNVLSSDSSLKKLNLEELDISSIFQPDKYEYTINIPYNYDKVNIIAEANDSNATVTGDGRRYLGEGENSFNILVKSTDGTFTNYTLNVIREPASNDATLKKLIVDGYVLSPKFNKDTFLYNIAVDKVVEEITINAESNYEFATVTGTGKFKLATGDNNFSIKVTAENGIEQIYTLVVNKTKGNSKLTGLSIKGYELDKEFSSNQYIYKINVKNNVDKLEINATSEDNDKIEIIGNENLIEGENSIIIRVSNEDKGATTYKILVNKLSKNEKIALEKNDKLLDILLIIFIASIIIFIVLIAVFFLRNYKKNEKIKNKKIKKLKSRK